jgi:hypothetical protein
MARILISAGHGGFEEGRQDPGTQAAGTTEAREMILLRDLVVTELRSRGFEVLSVPDDLSAFQTLDWINARTLPGDVALEIHADAFPNPSFRGSGVFYIANNVERKQHAELLLVALSRRVPIPARGVFPDINTGLGFLAFCRQLSAPSLYMQVGFLTNPDDRFIIQNQRRNVAIGIADGLAAWSSAVSGLPTPTPSPTPTPAPPEEFSPINININGQVYSEQGIVVNGNAYIPVDLADRLGVDVTKDPNVRKLSYRNVVYIRAVDLRQYNISIGWDEPSRTVILRSILAICPGDFDRISGRGKLSEVQLLMFLKSNNEAALAQFPDIAKLYREEGDAEGIAYDIAFSQMCLETNFLRFGGEIRPTQNNFAGLGSVGGSAESASFPSARIGVRAHIQHLKAYANTAPLVQEVVDPRFNFVTRGIAPLVAQLSGRWEADPKYGEKILALLRRLFESAGFL